MAVSSTEKLTAMEIMTNYANTYVLGGIRTHDPRGLKCGDWGRLVGYLSTFLQVQTLCEI